MENDLLETKNDLFFTSSEDEEGWVMNSELEIEITPEGLSVVMNKGKFENKDDFDFENIEQISFWLNEHQMLALAHNILDYHKRFVKSYMNE